MISGGSQFQFANRSMFHIRVPLWRYWPSLLLLTQQVNPGGFATLPFHGHTLSPVETALLSSTSVHIAAQNRYTFAFEMMIRVGYRILVLIMHSVSTITHILSSMVIVLEEPWKDTDRDCLG